MFTKKQLHIICDFMNCCTDKNICNLNHIRKFYSERHYIDHNDRTKQFKVYVKFKGWKP